MSLEDRLQIVDVVNNWALWRDAGDWERFRTVWHDDGWMSATWFQGPAAQFIEVSRAGFERGVSILHFLGGSSVDVNGSRAIAQTKMTINQRASVDGVTVDVVCTGRFYDFFEKRTGRWAIVRAAADLRKGSHRSGRSCRRVSNSMQSLLAELSRRLSASRLSAEPDRLRIKMDMPGLKGPVVQALYARGAKWLQGAASPFDEPPIPSGVPA